MSPTNTEQTEEHEHFEHEGLQASHGSNDDNIHGRSSSHAIVTEDEQEKHGLGYQSSPAKECPSPVEVDEG